MFSKSVGSTSKSEAPEGSSGATAQNLVATAFCRPKFLHPWCVVTWLLTLAESSSIIQGGLRFLGV